VVEEATEETPPGEARTDAAALAIAAAGGATTFLLVLAFTLFLLVEGDRYAGWAFMLLPKERRASARAFAVAVRERLSAWIIGWIGYAFVSAGAVGTILFALQVPTPWLFAVLAFLLALVPGLAVILAFVPAAILAGAGPPWQVLAVIVAGAIYHALDAMYIAPRLHAGVLQLPTFVGLVAVLIGVAIFGVWGGLIASPVAAVIAMTLNETLRPHARAA
jgi:predicted PurR-regulated permease PerM